MIGDAQLHGVGLILGVGVGLVSIGVGGIEVGDIVGVGEGEAINDGDGLGDGEGVGQSVIVIFEVIVTAVELQIDKYIPGLSKVKVLGTGFPSHGQI